MDDNMEKENKRLHLSMILMRKILMEMQEGMYRDMERLPPELEISREFGVSRTVVRDSLAMLEQEGFISRKHGLGTVINHHVLKIKTRIDIEKEFSEMICDAGYAPSVQLLDIRETTAGERVGSILGIPADGEVIKISRVACADGVPAIYYVDTIDKGKIVDFDYTRQDLQENIFAFLRKYCGVEVCTDLTEVQAVNASSEVSEILQVPEGSAVLLLDECGYDLKGQAVLHSEEYYRSETFRHYVVRKKVL